MTFKQRLESKGWHLSPEWIDQVSASDQNSSINAIINQALTQDLHDIGERVLPEEGGKLAVDELYGPLVLQVQKIRNAKSSKANAENKGIPTLLRLFLTDGFSSCSALQNGNLQKLKWNAPPGTKLLLSAMVPIRGGFLLINDSNVEVLGGSLTPQESPKLTTVVPTNGLKPPPPWVEFGHGIDMALVARAKDLRSLEVLADSEKPLENKQFEEIRSSKIKEIVAKKLADKTRYHAPAIYRAPKKQPQQTPRSENHYKSPVSKPQAASTKVYNFDLAESMHNLRMDPEEQQEQQPAMNNQRRGRGRGRRRGGHDTSDIQQRPSTGNTLFDFLESHLPSSQDAKDSKTHLNGPQNFYTNNHFAHPASSSRGYSRGMGNSGYMSQQQQPFMFRNRGRMASGGDYSRRAPT